MNNSRTLTMTYSALLCALLCIGAYFRIPIPFSPVPFTFQVAIVLIIACMLSPKNTAITISLYILIGLLGLPVFSSGGGLSAIFTASFGYLIGFLAGGVLMSYIYSSKLFKNRFVAFIIGTLSCLIVIYLIGVSYMYLLLNLYLNSPISISTAITKGALLFWIVDLAKASLAFIIVTALEKATVKTRRPLKS